MNLTPTSARTMITFRVPKSFWLPNGYEGIRDSVRRICDAHEGVWRPYSDPTFLDERLWGIAAEAIWCAVDGGQLRLLIFDRTSNGSEIPANVARAVPFLRSARVMSLVYLRAKHPLHREFVARFGNDFAQLALGFEKSEIEKLEHRIRRANSGNVTPRRGRPPIPGIRDAVQNLVEDARWSTSKSLKALTREVSRGLKMQVSADTVARELDRIFEDTGDPRFKRIRRKIR